MAKESSVGRVNVHVLIQDPMAYEKSLNSCKYSKFPSQIKANMGIITLREALNLCQDLLEKGRKVRSGNSFVSKGMLQA